MSARNDAFLLSTSVVILATLELSGGTVSYIFSPRNADFL